MTLGNRSVRVRPLNIARTISMIGMLAAFTAAGQLPSHGPAKGYLLITGGATQAPDYQRFIEMAGGKNARIVVIPTASVTKPTDQGTLQTQFCTGPKSPFAAVPCAVIHTTDRTVANSAEFVAPLTTATGVWIEGGRHWRLTDAYLDTRTLKELFKVLDRGGAIGGGSAGATVQGSYMVRGSSNPDDNTIMMLLATRSASASSPTSQWISTWTFAIGRMIWRLSSKLIHSSCASASIKAPPLQFTETN
jgi:cyanophycinase-like exopeptidase